MSLKLNDVKAALLANGVATTTADKIINELEAKIEENKPDNTGPKEKYKFVAIAMMGVSDPVLLTQVLETDDENDVPNRLKKSIEDYNNSKKGKKHPVKNWMGVVDVPRKFTKPNGVHVKSKNLVRLITISTNL